jgi:hypothetical protein
LKLTLPTPPPVPAVQFNKVYQTPCTSAPSSSFGSASDKRCSLGVTDPMLIYWSFESVPELAQRSKAEREAAVKRMSTLAMKQWEWWVALAVAAGFVAVGAWLGGRGISGAVGAGVGGAAGGALHHLAVIYIARKYHSKVLAGHSDAP